MAKGPVLLLGGGSTLWDDIDEVEALIGEPWPGAVIVVNDVGYGIGHTGRRWEGPVHHWCTLHAEKIHRWMKKREAAGLPGGYEIWSPTDRPFIDHPFTGMTGGSSGLYLAGVALHLGYPRGIFCGVPMDDSINTFSGKPWLAYQRYFRGWKRNMDKLRGRFKSPSGNTRDWLGPPYLEWIGLVPRVLSP